MTGSPRPPTGVGAAAPTTGTDTAALDELHQRLGGFVAAPRLEDYAARYAEHLVITRDGGVVEARLHHQGGPAVYSLPARNAWLHALRDIGNDPANEVLILTGTGDAWIGGYDPASFATPFAQWPAAVFYEHVYLDSLRLVETIVLGLDIPTIAAVNGPGPHREIALLCDITLCTEDTLFADNHTAVGQVPGDGLQLAFQLLMGPKTAAYHLYTGEPIDAQTALRLGLVNEATSGGELLPRARHRRAPHDPAPRHTQAHPRTRPTTHPAPSARRSRLRLQH